MTSEYKNALQVINESTFIDFDNSFSLSKACSHLLRSQKNEELGRDIAIRMIDIWSREQVEPKTYPLWNDLIEIAGLYPYVDENHLEGSSLVRFECHKSPYLEDVYFHKEQLDISIDLLSDKAVVLSAPTSFGKSLLIEEVIASKKYSNIVIIQPTLALLDETRKKLAKYRDYYNLIVSTSQRPIEGSSNIFLFTGERVVEYSLFPRIDFFVIDEFYKLSLQREDDRAVALNQAFYKLIRHTNKFYMLGPMIKEIPADLKERFKVSWLHTNFKTVAVDEILITNKKLKKEERQDILFGLLRSLEDPTLIYCASPQTATILAENFLEYLNNEDKGLLEQLSTDKNNDMIEWIKENIHPNWVLAQSLRSSIGFHHGALPRHLGSSIVDSFNRGAIRYLFCTSTLIEGVNTTAKNVILFDKKKGIRLIDYFDYRNIAGRSGRMKRHFIGRVFKFFEEPAQMEFNLDIPILTQDNAPLEILIQLDKNDLKTSVANRISSFLKLNQEEQVLLKNNSGLPVDGQLKIISSIQHNASNLSKLLSWTAYPKYEQLLPVLEMAWECLLKKGENKGGIHSPAQLAVATIRYCRFKSIKGLIETDLTSNYWIKNEPDINKRVNKVVFSNLNISRHWFQYKLPKLLRAMSILQSYALTKAGFPAGDYRVLANQLEGGFLPANLSILLEYDIPLSAAQKLKNHIKENVDFIALVKSLKSIDLAKYGLNNYEIDKLKAIFS